MAQSHTIERPADPTARPRDTHTESPAIGRTADPIHLGWPLLAGLLGALTLAALYLGLVAWAESWAHAWDLLLDDAPFVVPIVLGFGAQVGLFSYLRRIRHAPGGLGTSRALAGTSGTASTLGMVACCAHHVGDVLPLVGLGGAAILLAQYRVPFMVLGLVSNGIGVGVLALRIWRTRRAISTGGVCQ